MKPEIQLAAGDAAVFTRKCPSCDKMLFYKKEAYRDSADKKKSVCKECDYELRKERMKGEGNPFYGKHHTDEAKAKIGKGDHWHVKTDEFKERRRRQMTESNPNAGTDVYSTWLAKFGKEEADRLDADRKKKWSEASKGEKNPMYGKPTPQGAGNGWSGWYAGWFFRSLRELAYVVKVLDAAGLRWVTAERKEWRIPYEDWDGTKRTYAADFLVEDTRLVEIKPAKLNSSPAVSRKEDAARQFCANRGWTYELVDPDKLSDDEIRQLKNDGKIRFTDRYEKLYQEKYSI